MEEKSSEARTKARMRIVEEHLRLENLHDLDGILGTFGRDAQYDDEPWDDHRIGRDEVHLYYKELLADAGRLLTAINHPLTIAGAFVRKIIGH
jgi:hypothetical protein